MGTMTVSQAEEAARFWLEDAGTKWIEEYREHVFLALYCGEEPETYRDYADACEIAAEDAWLEYRFFGSRIG